MSKKNLSQKERLRRLTLSAMLVAAAFVISYIEAILPFSLGIPGVKLGFCHIVTLLALYRLSMWETISITAVRVVLSALLFGSVASLAYSAAGALLSLAIMLVLRRLGQGKHFSPLGISIAGGVTHNLGQLACAAALMGTPKLGWYLPVLLVAGVLCGGIIGIVAALILGRFQSK